MEHGIREFRRFLQVVGESHIRESLAFIVGIGAFGLGISYIFTPDTYKRSPAYAIAFQAADPLVWGLVFVTLALFLGLTFITSKKHAMWPALLITLTFIILTTFALLSVQDGVAPASAWINLTISAFCALLTASCAVYRDPTVKTDKDQEVPRHARSS